jgi:hypothetical protein
LLIIWFWSTELSSIPWLSRALKHVRLRK